MQDFFTWSNQKSIILTFEAFKNRCLVYSYQLKKNRIRMLKSLSILEKMHPDNTNVFASNIIDNYDDQTTYIQYA